MKLKHQWSERETAVLTAFKTFCREKSTALKVELRQVLQVQRNMTKVLREKGLSAEFYELWKFFGVSGTPSSWFADEHFLCSVLSQSAAAVLLGSSVIGEEAEKEIWKLHKKLFFLRTWESCPELRICLRDRTIINAAKEGNAPQVKLIYDISRNPEVKLKNVYHFLLNTKDYSTLMDVQELCGHLEDIGRQDLACHFYLCRENEGKRRFNHFFMEKFGTVWDENFWEEHRNTGNLKEILIPALEQGVPEQMVLFGSLRDCQGCTLHRFLAFIDEIAEELTAPAVKKVFSRFQQDVECAEIYFKWLDRKRKESVFEN